MTTNQPTRYFDALEGRFRSDVGYARVRPDLVEEKKRIEIKAVQSQLTILLFWRTPQVPLLKYHGNGNKNRGPVPPSSVTEQKPLDDLALGEDLASCVIDD
jgi:hypothetical protein